MVVVRFSMFLDKVEKGTKKQTIRLENAYLTLKVRSKIHCYSTKRKEGVRRPILDKLLYKGVVTEIILVPWRILKDSPTIAILDGFGSLEEFRTFFERKYKPSDDTIFKIIRWEQKSL